MKTTDATAGALQQSDVQASPDLLGGRVGEQQSSQTARWSGSAGGQRHSLGGLQMPRVTVRGEGRGSARPGVIWLTIAHSARFW